MRGDILFPLNDLKDKYPDVYERQAKKYAGREYMTRQRIPALDCLWNDVLHFSAVDPKEIKQSLIEAGRSADFSMRFYQIDPNLIDPKNTTVYLFTRDDDKDNMDKDEFVPYNPNEAARFSIMPQATKDYYRTAIAKGERPLLYYRIPHILYKGTLETTDLSIISV